MRKVVLLRILALATLLAILSRLPAISFFGAETILLYTMLTIGTVYLSVLLSHGDLSTAYAVGIIGTLLLPADLSMMVTWGVFVGGIVGSLLRAFYRQRRLRYHRTPPLGQNIVTLTARVTLSYILAGDAYRALGGQQPLAVLDARSMVPLAGFSVVYIIIYVVIFLLSVYINNRSIRATLTQNSLQIALTMMIPPPFIILSIVALGPDHALVSWLVIGELALFTVGLHWFSQMFYRLHKQSRELVAVTNINQAVRANQGLDALLEAVYREVAGLLFINHFEAILTEADDNHLSRRLMVKDGKSQVQMTPVDRQPGTFIDYVMRTQRPLLIEHDLPSQARRLGLTAPADRFSAWLGVPLLSGGRMLGMLLVASSDPSQYFGNEEQHTLTIIAAATSTALDNAQLYQQQMGRVSQLNNLNTVLALLTETLSPDDVLDHVISSASVVAQATAVAVYRYADEAFNLVRSAGLSDDFAAETMLTITPTPDQRVSIRRTMVVEDVASDSRVRHLQTLAQREAKHAWVELPLSVGGHPVGALTLYYDDPRRFESEHIELLRTFANQVAQAIHNADLYAGTYHALETRVEQLSALAAMGRDMAATMDLATLCRMLLNYALTVTDSQTGAIVLKEPESEQIELAASSGYAPAIFRDSTVLAQGITGQVLRCGQAVRCDVVNSNDHYLALNPTACSQMTVPIIWRDQTLGAITLESEKQAHYSDEDQNFIVQLANQAVFALENARLFNNTTEAHDRMQAILNTMTEAIILIDRRENIVLANPRVTTLLGLKRDLLVGQALDEALKKTNLATCMGFASPDEALRQVHSLDTPQAPYYPEMFAYTLSSHHAEIHIHREMIPVPDEQGEIIGALLVFYDQSEQHNLERAREEFSQMIIHDLRSPLTAVTSNVSMLSELVPPDHEFGSLVEKTTGSSQRAIRKLLNRVDSLLEIARMRSDQMVLRLETARLSRLVENVCAELEPLARYLDVHIVVRMPEDEPMMMIDAEKIERVLLNLVDNALKFSPHQSQIAIQATPWGDNGGMPLLRVDVIDNGPGIPDDERHNIFDRFVQVQQQHSPYRRGSGLGLNFCMLAIEAHEGTIWFEANPDGGSVFSFTLPVHPARGNSIP